MSDEKVNWRSRDDGSYQLHRGAVIQIKYYPTIEKYISAASDGTICIWRYDVNLLLSSRRSFAFGLLYTMFEQGTSSTQPTSTASGSGGSSQITSSRSKLNCKSCRPWRFINLKNRLSSSQYPAATSWPFIECQALSAAAPGTWERNTICAHRQAV
jgi:hypothetical protein